QSSAITPYSVLGPALDRRFLRGQRRTYAPFFPSAPRAPFAQLGPGRRTAANLPRDLADRTRFPVRPQGPRPGPGGRREKVPTLPGRPGQPPRPEPADGGDARRVVPRARLYCRWRHAGPDRAEDRLARSGLYGGKRTLQVCQGLSGRRLEPRAAGTALAAGSGREGRRVPAGRQRQRAERG